jgi:branched-chain amino acid transport system ATP-binding protein
MILELDGLSKFFGKTMVINNVSLGIKEGECHSIIGPNGAGKTTLFNLITGIHKPTAGSIKFKDEELVGKKPFEINRKGISRSFQITNIFKDMTVLENIRCSTLWTLGYRHSFLRSINRLKDAQDKAEAVLELMGMTKRRDAIAGSLAYAEQRLLEIAITIATGAEVIMLDEPTAGLSKHETSELIVLIQQRLKGKTLVLIEHDMDVVFIISDRISVLVYGEIIASGKPEEIRTNRDVQEAYLGSIEGNDGA